MYDIYIEDVMTNMLSLSIFLSMCDDDRLGVWIGRHSHCCDMVYVRVEGVITSNYESPQACADSGAPRARV